MSYGWPLDLFLLTQQLADCEGEALQAGAPAGRRLAAEALSMELWRQRHELVAAATAHARQTLDVARPFARVADRLDPAAAVVLIPLGTPDGRCARLKATDFFRARDLIRSAG